MGFPAETSDGEKIIIVETGSGGDEPIYRTEDGRRWKRDNQSGGQHKLICIDPPISETWAEDQVLVEDTVETYGFDNAQEDVPEAGSPGDPGPDDFVPDPPEPEEGDPVISVSFEDGTEAEVWKFPQAEDDEPEDDGDEEPNEPLAA